MTYSVLSCHKPSKSWALDFVSVNTQIALILCRLCYWLSSVKAHVSTISLSLGGTDRWFSGKTVSGKLWKHSDCGCVCPLQAGSSPHCAWHEDVLKRFYSPEHCASLWETAMLCFFFVFFLPGHDLLEDIWTRAAWAYLIIHETQCWGLHFKELAPTQVIYQLHNFYYFGLCNCCWHLSCKLCNWFI